jgi:hypothetical protein
MHHGLSRCRTDPFLTHNAVFFLGSLSVSLLNYAYYGVMGRLMRVEEFGEVQTLLAFMTQINLLVGVFRPACGLSDRPSG